MKTREWGSSEMGYNFRRVGRFVSAHLLRNRYFVRESLINQGLNLAVGVIFGLLIVWFLVEALS
jgi:hypothetical protein